MNLVADLNVPAPDLEAACRAFAIPDRVSASWSEVGFLGKGWLASLDVDGERLVFWMYGSGPVILLMHGWSSRGSHLKGFVKPLVAAGFSVAVLDAPGHGHSGGAVSSVIHAGRAALRLADHLGDIYGVIAHSTGSTAALWASGHGLSVQRSVHVCGPSSMITIVQEIARAHCLDDRQTVAFYSWVESFMCVTLASVDLQALAMGLRHSGLAMTKLYRSHNPGHCLGQGSVRPWLKLEGAAVDAFSLTLTSSDVQWSSCSQAIIYSKAKAEPAVNALSSSSPRPLITLLLVRTRYLTPT